MKKILIFLVVLYQHTLSPILKVVLGKGCRFTPTCSNYAIQAIDRFGIIKGGTLAIRRIGRCHPYSPGGNDPVPEKT